MTRWCLSGSPQLTCPRQPGQGGNADPEVRDLRAQLLQAEAAHYSKTKGSATETDTQVRDASTALKRELEARTGEDGVVHEDPEAKRRRILEATRDIDADSDGPESDSSGEDRSRPPWDAYTSLLN